MRMSTRAWSSRKNKIVRTSPPPRPDEEGDKSEVLRQYGVGLVSGLSFFKKRGCFSGGFSTPLSSPSLHTLDAGTFSDCRCCAGTLVLQQRGNQVIPSSLIGVAPSFFREEKKPKKARTEALVTSSNHSESRATLLKMPDFKRTKSRGFCMLCSL